MTTFAQVAHLYVARPRRDRSDDGITVIHLDEYKFVVTNKAGKLVGFQIQELGSHKRLDMFPLEPGETRSSRVTITKVGVRYRCPINVTPWYDLDVIK
jgi:hypothetical protein